MGWRNDIRNGYMTALADFKTANTDYAEVRLLRARPESLQETTSIYLGSVAEPIRLDSGTWQRVTTIELVCAKHLSDNIETTDDVEDLADAVVDWLAGDDRAHAIGAHTEQHPIRTQSTEIDEGGGIYVPAVVITCQATIQQGRT